MNLCKGFMTTRIEGEDILEVHYALLPDGTVLVTKELKRTNDFGGKNRRWFVCEHDAQWLKENAEFIGNYHSPSTRI